jgi:large subunit ribosomal protein L2
MAVIKLKPTSPGTRFQVRISKSHLYKGGPHEPLTVAQSKTGARNHFGRITTRHIGGGSRQKYRIIDFRRDKDGVAAVVERVEYDPNRTAHIALLLYADGERRYILAPKGVKDGDELRSGSAGGSANYTSREGIHAFIRLKSGETRKVHIDCRATLGELSNDEHNLRKYGKAGALRWIGVRPTVRGLAMNPVDHPHGGGEGKSGQGNPHPVSPWGWNTKGKKTRRNKRTSNMIVQRRN